MRYQTCGTDTQVLTILLKSFKCLSASLNRWYQLHIKFGLFLWTKQAYSRKLATSKFDDQTSTISRTQHGKLMANHLLCHAAWCIPLLLMVLCHLTISTDRNLKSTFRFAFIHVIFIKDNLVCFAYQSEYHSNYMYHTVWAIQYGT